MNSKYITPETITIPLRTTHREGERDYVIAKRKYARLDYVPGARTLHLVDLENLMGGTLPDVSRARAAVANYRSAMPVNSKDHVCVAVNPGLMVEASLAWKGARVLTGVGPDGADNALISLVRRVKWTASRYDRIVIGSGDHAFETVATAYRAVGIPVGVVGTTGSISKALNISASFVIEIPSLNKIRA